MANLTLIPSKGQCYNTATLPIRILSSHQLCVYCVCITVNVPKPPIHLDNHLRQAFRPAMSHQELILGPGTIRPNPLIAVAPHVTIHPPTVVPSDEATTEPLVPTNLTSSPSLELSLPTRTLRQSTRVKRKPKKYDDFTE
jgi:hypothetical protein